MSDELATSRLENDRSNRRFDFDRGRCIVFRAVRRRSCADEPGHCCTTGNDRLNGAKAYTAAPGVVVLYGMVFDDKDRALAEQVANGVSGVNQVVDNLRTKTGKWVQEEERIMLQLQMNGFNDVQARVVGPVVYLSGQVTGQAEKQRAENVVASVWSKQINNMIWVQPGSMF